jgi:hypothetical protein
MKRVKRRNEEIVRSPGSTATWEEASACPRCGVEGTKIKDQSASMHLGSRVYTMECRNARCRWGNDPATAHWLVQILPDGTIPKRKSGPKQWPKLPNMSQEAYDRHMENLNKELSITKRERGSSGGEVEKETGRIYRPEVLDQRRQQELKGDYW